MLHAGPAAVVTVRLKREAAQAVLEVEDNGPGIPPEARARAIGRFARGPTEGPGMGLGLPVVEEIAVLFGGTLVLDDGAGGGAGGGADGGVGGRGLIARIRLPLAL